MFIKYQHIERLGTLATDSLLDGDCHIFPKIDGANCSVWLENNVVNCGSRNQKLDLVSGGKGFVEYINNNKKYDNFSRKNPDKILYGEWLIPHTIKNYRNDYWRKFFVFDVCEQNGEKLTYLNYDNYSNLLDNYNIEYIPRMEIIINPELADLLPLVKKNNYLLPNDCVGEGIIIKRYDFVNRFGETVWAKIINDEFKNKGNKVNPVEKQEKNIEIECKIIDDFCPEAFIIKEFGKEKMEFDVLGLKYIPSFLIHMWEIFLREEAFNFIYKFNNHTINFKILNRLFNAKIVKIAKGLYLNEK